MTKDQIQSMMGTIVDPNLTFKNFEFEWNNLRDTELPEEFDARTNWSVCADLIGHARD